MKKILIIMTNMECGGVQVSMLNFLNELHKYDVDITLLLDLQEGEWIERIPQWVHVETVNYSNEGFHKLIWPSRKISVIQDLIYHIVVHTYKLFVRRNILRNDRYTFLLNKISDVEGTYDVAIDYHGYGFITTSILVNKVKANKKIVFIHDEKMDCLDNVIEDLSQIDLFCGVSKSCVRIFSEKFPELSERTIFFPNYVDVENIIRMANMPCELQLLKDTKIFITVGRVMWQKGYEMAVKIAQKLKENGIKFQWYCLGEGDSMPQIKKLIQCNNVEDCFHMLGRKDNPYPYMKMADLYIQPSRHEGFGLAVAEALILGRVVVATDIECIAEQITNNYNGKLVPYNCDEFVKAIMQLLEDDNLYKKIKDNCCVLHESKKTEIAEFII